MQQTPYWLHWNASSLRHSPPPSNTPIPWPTPLTILNGIRIHSAVLPQYTFWTDRPIHTQTHTQTQTDRWDRWQVSKNSTYARNIGKVRCTSKHSEHARKKYTIRQGLKHLGRRNLSELFLRDKSFAAFWHFVKENDMTNTAYVVLTISVTTTTLLQPFNVYLDFVQDYPGEPVPER